MVLHDLSSEPAQQMNRLQTGHELASQQHFE
jgi:hypothetical protein